jgi:hypothetical protein
MVSRTTAASKKILPTFALAVAAGVAGLAAPSVAQADPYLHVHLLGRVQGSGQPLASSVSVGPGDIVEYEIRVQLGAEGSVNHYAGASPTSPNTTITNWIPSNGAVSPACGLNAVRFNLSQESTASTIQSDFDSPTTPASGWANAPGNTPGTLSPRGNGNDDLNAIALIRGSGNFDGVAADESLKVVTVASGVFDIASGGSSAVVMPNITGLSDSSLVGLFRWRTADNTSQLNYAATALHQNNSTAGTLPADGVDPLIVYNGLNLVPEPSALGVVALAALGLGRRRRRRRAV